MINNECTLSQWCDSFCCLSLSFYVVCVCLCVCMAYSCQTLLPQPTLWHSTVAQPEKWIKGSPKAHRVGSFCPIPGDGSLLLLKFVVGHQPSVSDAFPRAVTGTKRFGPCRSTTPVCSWWPSSLAAPQTLSLNLSHTWLVAFLLWHPLLFPVVILISPPSTFS